MIPQKKLDADTVAWLMQLDDSELLGRINSTYGLPEFEDLKLVYMWILHTKRNAKDYLAVAKSSGVA